MSDITTARFAPGEVTPEQLEQYRLAYAIARHKENQALWQYEEAYRVYCDAMRERQKSESVYFWAQHGMVQDTTS